MRTYLMMILILLLSLAGCDKKSEESTLDGNYSGVYTRGDSSAVIYISISNGRFEGSSEYDKFPAICHGTVGKDDYTIEFDDECTWTADFDWNLILTGRYTYAFDGDKLTFYRGEGDSHEIYTIEKLKTE